MRRKKRNVKRQKTKDLRQKRKKKMTSQNQIDQLKLFTTLKKNLSEFQKELHTSKEDSTGKQILHSVLYLEFRTSSWYLQFPEVLHAGTVDGSQQSAYMYKTNIKPHGLINVDLSVKLPSIECNDGYVARWTLNPGTNIITSGSLVFNDLTLQSIDSTFIDNYNETMIEESAKAAMYYNIGNAKFLQEASKCLPSFDTSYMVPWFFSRTTYNYFPLYYCGFLDRLEHKFNFRRNLQELLVVYDEASGDRRPVDNLSIKRINSNPVTHTNQLLPYPTMWGTYVYMADIDCEYDKVKCRGTKSKEEGCYYIEDYVKLEEENPVTLNNTVTIDIKDIEFPVHGVFWFAQNQEAVDENFYSNYTTSSDRLWSPIQSTSLNNGNSFIFKDMPSYRTERVYPSQQLISVPSCPGLNNWRFALQTIQNTAQPGVIFKSGNIQIKLRDQNPYLTLKDELMKQQHKACSDYFKVGVYLSYIKKIKFEKYAEDEQKRNGTSSEIAILGNNM
jgi:hypothetical protein